MRRQRPPNAVRKADRDDKSTFLKLLPSTTSRRNHSMQPLRSVRNFSRFRLFYQWKNNPEAHAAPLTATRIRRSNEARGSRCSWFRRKKTRRRRRAHLERIAPSIMSRISLQALSDDRLIMGHDGFRCRSAHPTDACRWRNVWLPRRSGTAPSPCQRIPAAPIWDSNRRLCRRRPERTSFHP